MVNSKIKSIKTSGPNAVKASKLLVQKVMTLDPEAVREYNIKEIARIRITPEAQEGFSSFLEKRKPEWSL